MQAELLDTAGNAIATIISARRNGVVVSGDTKAASAAVERVRQELNQKLGRMPDGDEIVAALMETKPAAEPSAEADASPASDAPPEQPQEPAADLAQDPPPAAE